MITASRLATDVEERLLARNRLNAEFFARECARLGRTASDAMPVVCERFVVLYPPLR